MTNQTLSLVKESAVLSTITVGELTMAAIKVQGETFRPFEAFIMIALMYWALNETIATIMRRVEHKVSNRSNSGRTTGIARADPAVKGG
jgi:ABC-type amino acid transport system permease subunit